MMESKVKQILNKIKLILQGTVKFYSIILLSGLVSLLVFFALCDRSKLENFPSTSNKYLNTYLKEAPVSTIDLDALPIDKVNIQFSNILGRKQDTSQNNKSIIGAISGMIKIDNNIYIADHQQDCIWQLDEDGNVIRKIGRKGRGPGEFSMIHGIYMNSNYVYTIDVANSRINVYDHQLKFQTTINKIFPGIQFDIASTDSILLLPSELNNDKLVVLRNAHPPFLKLNSILPNIVRHNPKLRGFNTYSITSTNDGWVAFGFTGLPYIFVYNNNLEHVRTLFFRSGLGSEELFEPKVKMEGNKFMVKQFLNRLILLDKKNLLMLKSGRLYWITFTDNGYRLRGNLSFVWNNSLIKKDSLQQIFVSDAIVDHDTLYISSTFEPYVFRIPMDNITLK